MSTTYEQEHAADPLEAIPTLPEEPVTRQEIYERAAQIVEQGWCQNVPARTASGSHCTPNDGDAVRFCLAGSMERAVMELCGVDARKDGQGFPRMVWTNDSNQAPSWNNRPGRKRSEVAKVLRALGGGATWEEATS